MKGQVVFEMVKTSSKSISSKINENVRGNVVVHYSLELGALEDTIELQDIVFKYRYFDFIRYLSNTSSHDQLINDILSQYRRFIMRTFMK